MGKFNKITVLFVCVSILSVLGYLSIANGELQKQPPRAPLVIKPDLVVTDIYNSSCPSCMLGRTDFQNHPLVDYAEDIEVRIKNQGNAPSRPCKLKIELFDNVGARRAVIIKDAPGLNPGEGIRIKERGEYLFRKSDGIKATVDSTNVVDESDETNNSKTIKECTPVPVI